MKRFARMLCMLLSVLILTAALPFSASAEEDKVVAVGNNISIFGGAWDEELRVNARSNLAPAFSQTFDEDATTLTVTWWLRSPGNRMVNLQALLTYDDTKLSVDPEKNGRYDDDGDFNPLVLRLTNGKATMTDFNNRARMDDGNNHSIMFTASNLSGYPMSSDGGRRIPFVSVTFDKLNGAAGETDVELYIEVLSYLSGEDNIYLFDHSEIKNPDFVLIPSECPAAVYEGGFNADYPPVEEPTTEEPTTEEPTTEEPTTEEPATEEPTTEEPTTEEPTTEEPTTEESTTAPRDDTVLTVRSSSDFFGSSRISFDTKHCPSQVAVEFYAATDRYKIINGQYELDYDRSMLLLDRASNTDSEDEPVVCPVSRNSVCNFESEGVVRINFSDSNGVRLAQKDGSPIPVVRLVFDVLDKGDTEITLLAVKQTFKEFDAPTDISSWHTYIGRGEEGDKAVRQLLLDNGAVIGTDITSPDSHIIPQDDPRYAEVRAVADYLTENLDKPELCKPAVINAMLRDENVIKAEVLGVLSVDESVSAETYAAVEMLLLACSDPDPVTPGDVSDNGSVNVQDATLVQQGAADIITFTKRQKAAADVNRDGRIDIDDVTLIQKFAAEVIDSFDEPSVQLR